MIYRQGDVLIRKMSELDKKVGEGEKVKRDSGRIILAYGEVTGHAHAIHDKEAVLIEDDNRRFLQVLKDGGVDLIHEEHDTINLPKGDYEIVIQNEYSPEKIRNVLD